MKVNISFFICYYAGSNAKSETSLLHAEVVFFGISLLSLRWIGIYLQPQTIDFDRPNATYAQVFVLLFLPFDTLSDTFKCYPLKLL